MVKRKDAPKDSSEVSPTRPRTRSGGPLLDTQPRTPRKRTRLEVDVSPSKKPRVTKRRTASVEHESSSLKENDGNISDDSDELSLPPAKSRAVTPYTTRSRRLFLESVEIQSPSRRVANISVCDETSPSRGRPRLKRKQSEPDDISIAALSLSTPSKSKKSVDLDSPSKRTVVNSPIASPSKEFSPEAPTTPHKLPRTLPSYLYPCLNAQKRAILEALQNPPSLQIAEEQDVDDPRANDIASSQLADLLLGTVSRGEGNSCLLLGPRGSGKTRVSICFISLQLPP